MKFRISGTFNNARTGIVDGVDRIPQFSMETPNLFQYTKGGAIPHVTPDVLRKITKDNVGLYFPIPNISNIQERMKMYGGSIGDFVGMKNGLTYASIVDAGEERVKGYHKKKSISIWSKCGRSEMNVETYMDFMESLRPDVFVVLCDGDTEPNSSKKRVAKSLERTVEFFESSMELYKKSQVLEKSGVIGALEGGYSEEAREKCSAVIGESPVLGVIVDGLHNYGKQVSSLSLAQVKPMVEASLKHIPAEKLRICHGCWNPSTVLGLISLGIDILDTSYPYLVAEDGGALVFPNDKSLFEGGGNNLTRNGIIKSEGCDLNDSHNSPDEPSSKKSKHLPLFVSLHDKIYADVFEPISSRCGCLTCRNHTKSYIHHLLNVKELLGPILLMIHNLHHYFEFFKTIRASLRTGKFEELRKNFDEALGE